MIVLKIIGAIFAVIAILIFIILTLRVRIRFSFDLKNAFNLKAKILFFEFDLLRSKKKNPIVQRLKGRLGLDFSDLSIDEDDELEDSISELVSQIIAALSLLIGQLSWLVRHCRLDKLRVFIVCGGDAAEAALEYGTVCATVYPIVGYLSANLDAVKNAEDVRIGCDFDGEPQLEFDLFFSLKIFHILKAIYRALEETAEIAELNQEATQ